MGQYFARVGQGGELAAAFGLFAGEAADLLDEVHEVRYAIEDQATASAYDLSRRMASLEPFPFADPYS